METAMSVDVRGEGERLYELASDVPRWAEFLPHYRYIRVLATNGPQRTVVMAARRGWIPLRWTSVLELVPQERRIIFQHVGGPARGMQVEWTIEQRDGFARATIRHDLRRLAHRIVATPLGRYILAHWFIDPVAGKTLRCMRDLVESGRDRAARGLPAPAGPHPRAAR